MWVPCLVPRLFCCRPYNRIWHVLTAGQMWVFWGASICNPRVAQKYLLPADEIAGISQETRETPRHTISNKPNAQPRRLIAAFRIIIYRYNTIRQLRVRPVEWLILNFVACSYALCSYLRA